MTKTKDIIIRIRLEDYRRLRRYIKSYPGESVAHYFERVINRMTKTEDIIWSLDAKQ